MGGACAWLALGCTREGSDPAAGTGDTGAAPTPTGTPTGADYPCGQAEPLGGTALPLADYPDLAAVGGWSPVTVEGRSLVVAHVQEGCFAAIERACAHEGVPIDYRPDRSQFVCPRHGAVYAADGAKISGPQATGLPVYPCARVGDAVVVSVG